jgi:hypothetical protein
MYKLYKNPDNQEIIGVQKNQNMWIPFALDNTDYQEYLKWVAEGNEPLPADE